MSGRAKITALITGRGGSKRVPRKNVMPVGGKPLIAWTADAALRATTVQRTILSSDDSEIIAAARAAGVEVPFIRPADLASDAATHADVLEHALSWLEQNDALPDYLLLLQPTCPLREAADIDAIVNLALTQRVESAVSVTPTVEHPWLQYRLGDTGRLEALAPRPKAFVRSQDFPPTYVLNGALYLFTPAFFRREHAIVTEQTLAYVMPRERSLDVDTAEQLQLADFLLSRRQGE